MTDPPEFHLFDTEQGHHLLIADGSRVFTIPPHVREMLAAIDSDTTAALASLGLEAPPYIGDAPPSDPPVRSLSLAVAQACNLGCAYCYAQGGTFGGTAQLMTPAVALAAVDLLFADARDGDAVNLAFLGGEPLTNRRLVRQCTERAAALGKARGVGVRYSITTNGTLLTLDDGEFFEHHGFAVTISLDGVEEAHDRLRPFADGRGSYRRVLDRVLPLLARQHRMQASARVTVTPLNLDLRETLDAFLALGFHTVGFSPMLASPSHDAEMTAADLDCMLERMIECGREFERRVARGERYAFQNMSTAMHEIHRGTHRPYPCGAGGSYFGVAAGGDLAACHRFVQDSSAILGDVWRGVDRRAQRIWLADRHVHRQEPCRSCWARYLCGGGCHHEVLRRGRPACEYIRGWLHYCLQAYVRLLDARPEYFNA